MNEERAAFEAWSQSYRLDLTWYGEVNTYFYTRTAIAWAAWQARAARDRTGRP